MYSLSYILVYFIAGQKSFEVVSQTSRPALQVLMEESHFYFFFLDKLLLLFHQGLVCITCAFIFIQNVKKCVPAKRIISLDNDDGDDDDDDDAMAPKDETPTHLPNYK